MRTADMGVYLIGWTRINLQTMRAATGRSVTGDGPAAVWDVDDDEPVCDGEALVEFAGRACYQSWTKPNPATATNAGYIEHLLDMGHYSVLEHGVCTFYLTGVSRSLTHELVRHRHLSYSQLSQRYVPGGETATVVPPIFADDVEALHILDHHQQGTDYAYAALTKRAEEILSGQPHCPTCSTPAKVSGPQHDQTWTCTTCTKDLLRVELRSNLSPTARRKQARQAARAVLPNAAETRIVVTGNYRAWRHFVTKRATEHADVEIRTLAVKVLRHLQQAAPNVFADFTIRPLPDGTEVAETPHGEES